MKAMSFTGWVEKIPEVGQYDREIVVRNWKDEKTKNNLKDLPSALTFKVGSQSAYYQMIDDLVEGDHVVIQFYLMGKSGISKAGKYYHINELRIAKNKGIEVLAKVQRVAAVHADDADDGSDIPF